MRCPLCKKELSGFEFFNQNSYQGVDYRSWYRQAPICKACFSSKFAICRKCHRHFEKHMSQSNSLCKSCYAKTSFCSKCGKELQTFQIHRRNGKIFCAECDEKEFVRSGGKKQGVVLTDTEDVIVFSQKRPCPNHQSSVGCVTAYAVGIEDAELHPINIFYCAQCHLYYINMEQYLSYAQTYGLPVLNMNFQNHANYGYADYSEWNQQSILNFRGYNVNETEGLSSFQRQRVLRDCIDSKIMTKAQVCSFLESMISLHEKRHNYILACQKWQTDLNFVREYRMDEQRLIKAQFVMKKYY